MRKGIASINAMIAFIALVSFNGLIAEKLLEQTEKISSFNDSIKAEGIAKKCSLLINSLYANSGGRIKELKVECFVEGEKIKGKVKGKETGEFVIPEKFWLEEGLNERKLRVEVNEHYWKKEKE